MIFSLYLSGTNKTKLCHKLFSQSGPGSSNRNIINFVTFSIVNIATTITMKKKEKYLLAIEDNPKRKMQFVFCQVSGIIFSLTKNKNNDYCHLMFLTINFSNSVSSSVQNYET